MHIRAILNYHWDWPHQATAMHWMTSGLLRHGIEVTQGKFDTPERADFAVIWGWRQPTLLAQAQEWGMPILVMERGHLAPREAWVSCGWNGLANHGTYARSHGSERWNRYFGHLMQAWRPGQDGSVLVCGQIPGDAALNGLDLPKWASTVITQLVRMGKRPVFRPHPGCPGAVWTPANIPSSNASLIKDLCEASEVVTYNSTVGVESVLFGVPTIAMNIGSMAWDVSVHSLTEPLTTPERSSWAERLAWAQWLPEEIARGDAWPHIASVMPRCFPSDTS